jgi:hypothetical protein
VDAVPIEMTLIDVSNLHLTTKFKKRDGLDERFLLALVKSDKEIFSYKAV